MEYRLTKISIEGNVSYVFTPVLKEICVEYLKTDRYTAYKQK